MTNTQVIACLFVRKLDGGAGRRLKALCLDPDVLLTLLSYCLREVRALESSTQVKRLQMDLSPHAIYFAKTNRVYRCNVVSYGCVGFADCSRAPENLVDLLYCGGMQL